MKRLAISLFLVVFFMGCAHYDPLAIEQLSQSHQRDTELTVELCKDFYLGAEALSEGPERAYPWLGRAREVDGLHIIMRKQGAACYEVESRDVSSDLEKRALDAFKRTWIEAERVVE